MLWHVRHDTPPQIAPAATTVPTVLAEIVPAAIAATAGAAAPHVTTTAAAPTAAIPTHAVTFSAVFAHFGKFPSISTIPIGLSQQ